MMVDSANYTDLIAKKKGQVFDWFSESVLVQPGASIKVFSHSAGPEWVEGKVECYLEFEKRGEIVVTYSVNGDYLRKRLNVDSWKYKIRPSLPHAVRPKEETDAMVL